MSAGRSCPLAYRYAPASMRGAVALETDTLYVVGGLYGNSAALETVLEMFDAETGPKHLIFNGDFNWFNVSPNSFRRINETVLCFDAIRGNVETELSATDQNDPNAGCGCAYPDWVGDEVVQYSNQIMQQLAATAALFPTIQQQLAALPMWRRIQVGGLPLAIVHGDAESLAGWGFAQELLADPEHVQKVQAWFDAADVRLFASSHTCAPILKTLRDIRAQDCIVANNGAAGMPNFSGVQQGLLTRIACTAYAGKQSCYGTKIDGLFVDALQIPYNITHWENEFLAQWPLDSPAHRSYWNRISQGPSYRVEQAFKI